MKKPTLSRSEIDALIRWAARDQTDLGLDVITDGEGYRENMYYFYQKRLDGVTFESMLKQSFGTAGFGIECPRVVDEIKNPRFELAHNWKLAREAAPGSCRVKQTVTGPHVLTRFSVNQRPDLYPDEQTLCRAYAKVLADELREVIAAGCDYIQFDEPMWTESPEVIRQRVQQALEYFSADRLLLTSECGFGHVPLEITRQKLRVLSETCHELRTGISVTPSSRN